MQGPRDSCIVLQLLYASVLTDLTDQCDIEENAEFERPKLLIPLKPAVEGLLN